MRALTLKPHWAHAVAHLGKHIENRSRPIPRAHVGTRVAIHAGASLPTGWLDQLLDASPRPVIITPGRMCGPRRPGVMLSPWKQPEGATDWRVLWTRSIVATAVLAMCDTGGMDWDIPWADPTAKWWWRLTDVRTLEEPIPCQRGQLGLWTLPDDIAAQLAEVSDG